MADKSIRDLETDVRVSVLETQVTSLTGDIVKIEKKMDENYGVLHKRINALDETFEEKNEKILQKIEDHSIRSEEHTQRLLEKFNEFDKWRWMMIGGALVVGYFIAHIKIEKLF